MTAPPPNRERFVIRRERGVPRRWLVAATIVLAGGLAAALPALVGPRVAQPAPVPTVAAFPAPVAPAAPPRMAQDAPRIDAAEARVLVDRGDAVVIDARDRRAFMESHLPGAINVTPNEAVVWARRGDLGRPILVYCD